MYYPNVRTYAEWQDYIANGRPKHERTLYDRGWRIRYANKYSRSGDLHILCPWWSTTNDPIITIHPDDTMTIAGSKPIITTWGGTFDPLRAYSVRFSIFRYTGIEVVQRNYKFRIYEQDAGFTPPKIQGCRTCRQSGLLDSWCSPSGCYNIDLSTGICSEHGKIDPNVINYGRHIIPCEHGNRAGHTVIRGQTCYACAGTKKRDYGSQRISLAWDGSPLKVKDGKIVRRPLTNLERIVESYVGPTTTV